MCHIFTTAICLILLTISSVAQDSLSINSNKNTSKQIIIDSVPRLKKSEFLYADSYRHTILGTLPPIHNNTSLSGYLLTGAGVSALFVGQHLAQANTIWKNKTSFRVIEDGVYGLYVDKAGHFVSSYLSCYMLGEAMFAADMNEKTAKLLGGILGLSYVSYIEIMDGYGVDFGFSPSDWYFDAAGAGFYILQSYIPQLENVTPKFTYINAEWHGDHKRIPHDFFVDDYASQTFWLSFNVHNMLPDKLQDYWFPWLNIAVGYTARNIRSVNPNDPKAYNDKVPDWGNRELGYYGEPRFIIGLDYDLTKIVPVSKYGFLNWLVQSVNYFKLPAPAVEFDIKGRARFVLLYPFL